MWWNSIASLAAQGSLPKGSPSPSSSPISSRGGRETIKEVGGNFSNDSNQKRRHGDMTVLGNFDDKKVDPEFCIDAGRVSSVARFINHSCEPTLFVQCVLSTHHDIKMAKVMLFAADNIPPLQRRPGDMTVLGNFDDKKVDPEFCIDAGRVGSVARFINHSCEPNLFVQCVLSTHHDIKMAKVMLFAADNIPPLQEFCYDYGYALNSVVRPDGSTVQLACFCGAAGCCKRLY